MSPKVHPIPTSPVQPPGAAPQGRSVRKFIQLHWGIRWCQWQGRAGQTVDMFLLSTGTVLHCETKFLQTEGPPLESFAL